MGSDELHTEVDTVPNHIGIIMDGNGRWAKRRNLPRTAGHYEGVKAAKRVATEAARLHIPYLTYYVFSTENWKRPTQEVTYLMNLLSSRLFSEFDFYRRIGAHVVVRGDIESLQKEAQEAIKATDEATKEFTNITISLAINYGGHDEIIRAVNKWSSNTSFETPLCEKTLRSYFQYPQIPPVDFIIRSGGEQRLSNFLLWDAAYAELIFYDSLWPDWGAKELNVALDEYKKRNRRYGGVIV